MAPFSVIGHVAQLRLRSAPNQSSVWAWFIYMTGIDQGDQNIDVWKIRHYGNSYRKRFTNSSVTGFASGRTGSNRMPLRVRENGAVGCIAGRAGAEITSPTVLRSSSARSFAALSTLSSMFKVVRLKVLSGRLSISERVPCARCEIERRRRMKPPFPIRESDELRQTISPANHRHRNKLKPAESDEVSEFGSGFLALSRRKGLSRL